MKAQKKQRILITGASGRVGVRVIPLLKQKYDLILTDLKKPENSDLPFIQADLTDFNQVQHLMRGVDAIVHLAIAADKDFIHKSPVKSSSATRGMFDPQWFRFKDAMVDINVRGTFYLYEAARFAGVQKIVFFSSLTTMLGKPEYGIITSKMEPRPMNFYACTKLFGEHLAELYSREFGISSICLRLGQPYPLNIPLDESIKKPRFRGLVVGHLDTAKAIDCALRAKRNYGVYYIISRSDTPYIDTSKNEEIHFKALQMFSEQGEVSLQSYK